MLFILLVACASQVEQDFMTHDEVLPEEEVVAEKVSPVLATIRPEDAALAEARLLAQNCDNEAFRKVTYPDDPSSTFCHYIAYAHLSDLEGEFDVSQDIVNLIDVNFEYIGYEVYWTTIARENAGFAENTNVRYVGVLEWLYTQWQEKLVQAGLKGGVRYNNPALLRSYPAVVTKCEGDTSWGWTVTTLSYVVSVLRGHPGEHHLLDEKLAADEKMWMRRAADTYHIGCIGDRDERNYAEAYFYYSEVGEMPMARRIARMQAEAGLAQLTGRTPSCNRESWCSWRQGDLTTYIMWMENAGMTKEEQWLELKKLEAKHPPPEVLDLIRSHEPS
ncbi:MAG: hypothetical protein WC730_00110 [Patescibacteria group bacterium]|jgi:hypothetical protein